MSSVRRALFKEGSNSWVAETIDEKQSIDEVENNSAEIVEYTVVCEGDVTFKTQLLENQRGLKTPQEKLLQRGTSSFYEKVNYKDGVVYLLYEKYGEKKCVLHVILCTRISFIRVLILKLVIFKSFFAFPSEMFKFKLRFLIVSSSVNANVHCTCASFHNVSLVLIKLLLQAFSRCLL